MQFGQKKGVEFLGDALDKIRDFPSDVKNSAGHQIDRVQSGLNPNSWRPMPSVGPSVAEIKLREPSGAFRVFYVANRPEAVYILHAFQKKTQKTEKKDIDLARERLKEINT